MDNNLKKDMEQMLKGAESMMKHVEQMAKKTFQDISPEQGKLFADYLNSMKMGDKLKDIQKKTEELKKQVNAS